MANEDLRIPQLQKATTGFRDGKYPKYNPVSDTTEQVSLQEDLGAVRASMEWQVTTTYAAGDFVLFQGLTAWKSKVSSNTGNSPSENSFWTSQTISTADGITLTQYATGLFTYNSSLVVNNFAIYQLNVSAPFESTDFATELTNTDWKFVGTIGLVDQIDFTANNNGYLNRRINWDEGKKCPAFFNDKITSRHQIGRELWKRAINRTGVTIVNGKVVKAGPTDGPTGLPTMVLASATDVDVADIIGFVTHNCLDDEECEIVPFGDVNDIDTSLLSEGAVYLSAVAGDVVNSPPLSPDAVVLMGRAEVINASTGRIYANVNQAIFPTNVPLNASWSAFSGSITGPNYLHGFYTFEGTAVIPGGQLLGTANVAYGAHPYIVLGASSTDMVVRFTGTSYDDITGRTVADFEDVDTSGGVLDDYFEFSKKFIGQVTMTLQSGTGVIVDYGWAKYWDNQNDRFVATGFSWTGIAGANDTGPNISIFHHRPIDWTFTGSGAIPPPPSRDMQSDYVTEFQFASGQPFAYKILGTSEVIKGELSEGAIIQIDITSNNAVRESAIEFNKIG